MALNSADGPIIANFPSCLSCTLGFHQPDRSRCHQGPDFDVPDHPGAHASRLQTLQAGRWRLFFADHLPVFNPLLHSAMALPLGHFCKSLAVSRRLFNFRDSSSDPVAQCWSYTHLFYPDLDEEDNTWETALLRKMSPPEQTITSRNRFYFSLFYTASHVFTFINTFVFWAFVVPKGHGDLPRDRQRGGGGTSGGEDAEMLQGMFPPR